MKKISFLVAFVAFLQIAAGSPTFAQDRLSDDARRTVEEALDLAGDDIGEELEELVQQLEQSADQIGKLLERWAEDNSQELEAWSEKHAREWESWGERFGKKMEELSADQDDVWGQWARGYEKNLQRWADKLDSNELEPKQIGEFVESNLKTLSKMPLGQLVDRAVEDGLGQLSDAPWESLDELGALAKTALDKPLNELTEILDENSDARRAIERTARGIGSALEHLDDDISRNISDSDDRPQTRKQEDPRIRALIQLRQRDGLSQEQSERIDEMIKTIQDASHLRDRERPSIDVPRGDQIKEKIEREKKRHAEALRKIEQEFRRSEESKQEMLRKSNVKSKQLDGRLPKRADGKNVDGNLKNPTHSRPAAANAFQRDGRDGKANRKPAAESKATKSDPVVAQRKIDEKRDQAKSEIDILREELSKLRREIQEMKKGSDK